MEVDIISTAAVCSEDLLSGHIIAEHIMNFFLGSCADREKPACTFPVMTHCFLSVDRSFLIHIDQNAVFTDFRYFDQKKVYIF